MLVRHPPADVAPGLCYGRLDMGLRGDMATALGAVLAQTGRVDRVWTSPARRCRVFAEAIAAAHGLPAMADERLQELDFGTWEGRPWEDVPRRDLDHWAAAPLAFAPPGGETGQQLLDRVRTLCIELRRAGKDALVVTHGGPLRIMPALLRGERPDLLAPAPGLGEIVTVELGLSAGRKRTQNDALDG